MKKIQSILEFYKSARNQLGTENIEIALRHSPIDIKKEMKETSISDAVKTKDYFSNTGKLEELSSNHDIKKALEIIKLESTENDSLLDYVRYGVCYHNSGLSGLVKETIEDLLRKNLIKFAFTTTTFAQGMNFPISTVIFETIKFRGDHEF